MEKISIRWVIAVLMLISLPGMTFAEQQATRVTVPRISVAPVMDGKIGRQEWADAASICGMVNPASAQLEAWPMQIYLARDAQNFYLAARIPQFPDGARFVATRSKRDAGYKGDDCLELWLDPHAGSYRKGDEKTYHFFGNSKGHVILDMSNVPKMGLVQMTEWNGRWNYAVTRDGDWLAEVSIPLSDLEAEALPDGQEWAVHISRVWSSVKWTTLCSIPKTRLVAPDNAPRLVMGGDVFCRLNDVSGFYNGKPTAAGEIVNDGVSEKTVTLQAWLKSADGSQIISRYNQVMKIEAGQRLPFTVAFDRPVLDEKNLFEFSVSDDKAAVLFAHSFHFTKTGQLPQIVSGQAQRVAFDGRYLPSWNKYWVDALNITDLLEEMGLSTAWAELEIRGPNGVIAKTDLPMENGVCENINVPLPELPEGDYQAQLRILDEQGKELDKVSSPFRMQKAAFLGNKLGITDQVLPPFTPIAVKQDCFSVWGRDYQLGDGGLLQTLKTLQPEPTVGLAVEDLLRAPMSFTLRDADGTEIPLVADSVKVTQRSPENVLFESAWRCPVLDVVVHGSLEYDGLLSYTLDVVPSGNVEVGGLTLNVPFSRNNSALMHEITDTVRRVFAGAIPAGSGQVWDSARIKNSNGILGNFKPMLWIGNEDRGLTWFSDSDRGWLLSDEKPVYRVLRQNDDINLCVDLINTPATLTDSRRMEFGFIATPVKSLPEGWRAWTGSQQRPHRNYPNLRNYVFLGSGKALPYSLARFSKQPGDLEAIKETYARDGCKWQTYYFAHDVTSVVDMQQLAPAYLGELVGPQPRKELRNDILFVQKAFGTANKDYYSIYRNKTLTLPIHQDLRLFTLNSYLEALPEFPFYEDNAFLAPQFDPAQDIGYQRPDGEWQPEFCAMADRALYKRIAGLYAARGQENSLMLHKSTTMMPHAYSFATVALDGEQRFPSAASDHLDLWPLDYTRAHVMGRQFGLVPFCLSSITKMDKAFPDPDYRVLRAELALFFLHEIHIWPTFTPSQGTEAVYELYQVFNDFNIGASDVVFHPYWQTVPEMPFECASPSVQVSAWSRPESALVVIANTGDRQDAEVQLSAPELQGFTTAYDWETKKPVSFDGSNMTLSLPRHDFRLIWIGNKPPPAEAMPTAMGQMRLEKGYGADKEAERSPVKICNGDFEEGAQDGIPDDWELFLPDGMSGDISLTTSGAFAGIKCAVINKQGGAKNAAIELRQALKSKMKDLQPGRRYLLSAAFRGPEGGKVRTTLILFDKEMKRVSKTPFVDCDVSDQWKPFKYEFTMPEGAFFGRIYFRMFYDGTFGIDDVGLAMIEQQ